MTTPEKILTFFTTPLPGSEFCRMDILNIRRIEIQAGIPLRSLFDFLKGKKYCYIEKHIKKLVPVLEFYGF